MIPGKLITLADGNSYVIPPLTFRQMRCLDEEKTTATLVDPEASAADKALATFRFIHQALARNYPEVTEEQMQDLLDIGLIGDIFPVIFGKLPPGERTTGPKV